MGRIRNRTTKTRIDSIHQLVGLGVTWLCWPDWGGIIDFASFARASSAGRVFIYSYRTPFHRDRFADATVLDNCLPR